MRTPPAAVAAAVAGEGCGGLCARGAGGGLTSFISPHSSSTAPLLRGGGGVKGGRAGLRGRKASRASSVRTAPSQHHPRVCSEEEREGVRDGGGGEGKEGAGKGCMRRNGEKGNTRGSGGQGFRHAVSPDPRCRPAPTLPHTSSPPPLKASRVVGPVPRRLCVLAASPDCPRQLRELRGAGPRPPSSSPAAPAAATSPGLGGGDGPVGGSVKVLEPASLLAPVLKMECELCVDKCEYTG